MKIREYIIDDEEGANKYEILKDIVLNIKHD